MRKIALALVAVVCMTSVSYADPYDWRRGPRPGYGYPHHEYRGGGDNGGAIVGGLIGGMIIGGMLNQMAQPQYAQPQYVDPDYQPICQRVVTGQYWNGWQWVYRTRVICQ